MGSFFATRKLSKHHILGMCVFSMFLFYLLLKKEWFVFYYILSKISGGFSALVGTLISKPISMGPSYSGIDIVILFLIALIAAFFIYKQISVKKCFIYASLTLLIWGFYIGLWTGLAESSIALSLNLLEPLTGPLDYRALLFAMLLVLYTPIYRKFITEDTNVPIKKIVKFLPAGLFAICMVIVMVSHLSSQAPVKKDAGQIVFWDTGIDFSVPGYEKYGLDYVGMFGILPHYLNQNGYNCVTVNSPNEALLGETDVLVVFNPMYVPSEDELAAIRAFVEDGGSVLAAGDHTGEEQVRLPLNAILEPANISLNFDSAIPFKSLWAEDYRLMTSPILSGITGSQVQIVVGASLTAGYTAKPLIFGKYGYSDLGDINNVSDGYLGNMHFNRGERIGDLLLAAEASYGKGKFMVFGDTTPFQNTVISYSYPFINNIFAYLCNTEKPSSASWESDGFFKASCIIDASHLEVINRDKSGDSMDGFIAGAMRAGFMPYLNRSEKLTDMLENRSNVKLVVLMEPAVSFSEVELKALERFMETGGTVILCAGYESPGASKALAAHFGFSFDPMPIGRVAPDKNPDMAFWNACPVLYQGNPGDTESIMEIWGYSTIAYKPLGSGGLYVFADPDFLKNKNLEHVDSYWEGNVLFLDTVFKDILDGMR